MIPLRDKNPSNITPWLVYALIAANVLAFLFELSLDTAARIELLDTYGFVAGLVLIKLIPPARPKKGPVEVTRLPRREYWNKRDQRGHVGCPKAQRSRVWTLPAIQADGTLEVPVHRVR